MTRARTAPRREVNRLFGVIGVVVAIVLAVGLYISYNANNGLPFQRLYHVSVDVPNADRLIAHDEVRIGGVRVGQVTKVTARVAASGRPYSRIEIAVERDQGPLAVDTRSTVRPASILGASYLDLVPGSSSASIRDDGVLPLARAGSSVELTDLLSIFDTRTRRSFTATMHGLGPGLAGRGRSLNTATASLARLLRPLERAGATLAAPSTGLGRFVLNADRLSGAVAPVRDELAQLFGNGQTTFAALVDSPRALGDAIDAAAPAERAATDAFVRLRPALDGLADIIVQLRPAAHRLPGALRDLNPTLHGGIAPFRRLGRVAFALRPALSALGAVSRDRNTSGSLRRTADVLDASATLLEKVLPAQLQCNFLGLWGNNFGDVFASGVGQSGPLFAQFAYNTLGAQGEIFQHGTPSPDVGLNYLPNNNYDECETGNEPWDGKAHIGNRAGLQSKSVPLTAPPPGTLELAQKAGLTTDPGTR